jgi:hypothetical protein
VWVLSQPSLIAFCGRPTFLYADATGLKHISDLQQPQKGANTPSSHVRAAPLTRIMDIAEMIRSQPRWKN